MSFSELSNQGPDFNFVSYFEGHTRASGWFADRFGNVKRHFCGDFFGEVKDNVFVLTEVLYYSDGVIEDRVWNVEIDASGKFLANSESLIGQANGVQKGSGLHMQYTMNVKVAEGKFWNLNMDDYMFFQPDQSLHNSTKVKKWGIRIGSVSTQYQKHDGSQICMEMQERAKGLTAGKLTAVS